MTFALLALVFAACGTSGGNTSPDSGTNGSGGSSGHGGSAGSGGSGGHAGSGGASGSGGSGGVSGSAGSSGSGGASGAGGSAGDGGGGKTLFAPGTICNKSGKTLVPPATVEHVIVFMFENEDFSAVNGSTNAPYMNAIAADCAYSSKYDDDCFDSYLESCPHYLALTSGSNCDTGLGKTGTGCITNDDDATVHTLSTTSIFQQVSSWKSYEESMPTNCDPSSSGNYATKHNPAAYYSALSTCSTNDVPIAAVTCDPKTPMTACSPAPSNALTADIAAGTLPAFSFVTPNLDNDMHNGTVTEGDNWLYTYLPLVLASDTYLNGQIAIFVLWDQQSLIFVGGSTPNFFVSPYITAGTVSTTEVNHFASLLAVEKMLGVGTFLGCASGTQPGGGACPAGSTADLRSAINF